MAKIFPVGSVNRKAVGFSPGVALGYVSDAGFGGRDRLVPRPTPMVPPAPVTFSTMTG